VTSVRALIPSAILLLALTAVVSGCAAEADAPVVRLPPVGAGMDYQLGGAYEPDPRVGIVARDRTDEPAAGRYSICYVNAFQTQPGERSTWPDGLVLRAGEGGGRDDVIDPEWPDEALLDTRTDAARRAIADRIGEETRACAEAGFDAVEFDNLDSYTRSDGLLSVADNLALAEMLVQTAHEAGLAAAQKNAGDDATRFRAGAGFDFAVVEECVAYDECGAYASVYGDHVVVIEYADDLPRPFAEVCADPRHPETLVLRDRELVLPGEPGYVFELCP
jgi:Glycoside-hydrolase family GH114